MQKTPFQKYVALANEGRNGTGLIVVGLLLLGVAWLGTTVIAAGFIGIVAAIANPDAARSPEFGANLLTGRTGAIVILGSIGAFWVGVWLALRYVHRRAFVTVLGAEQRIDRSDVVRGLLAALLVSIGLFALGALIEGMPARGSISLTEWLLWLVPMLGLLFLQTSGEELAFRGYLSQALAQRFGSPAIWAGIPIAIFTLLHWFGAANPSTNAAALFVIASLATSMTLLVYLTGNLGAAMGVHWGNNIAAFLLFSNAPELEGIALFQYGSLADPSMTTYQAVQLAVVGVFAILATLWLLLHPASPLRLKSLARPE